MYLQQFVKLGFPLFNAISTNFLIWDADAVLVAPFEPVVPDGQLRLVTRGYSYMPQVTGCGLKLARLPARARWLELGVEYGQTPSG